MINLKKLKGITSNSHMIKWKYRSIWNIQSAIKMKNNKNVPIFQFENPECDENWKITKMYLCFNFSYEKCSKNGKNIKI